MDGSLTINLRSPSMSETMTLTTDRDASVRSLKRLIHTVHPKKPSINDQRIIFGGKLLNDADILSRILEKTDVDSIPTFHLVVKPTAASTIASSSSSHIQTTVPPVPVQQAPPIEPQVSQVPAQQLGYPPLLPGGYQVVALNGQYYLAPVLVPAHTLPRQHPLPQYQPAPQYHQPSPASNNTRPNNPAPQQQPARPPVLVHAQNQVQRATSIWLALKLIFILFILCQDASLERILFFHVLAFIFFLYQTGRLRFVIQRVRPDDLNRPQQPPQQPQQPPQQPPQPQPQQQGSAPATPQPGTEQPQQQDEQASSERPRQNQPRQPPTLLATLKRGAYTFIASLWPNYGHDARIAQALDNGQNEAVGGVCACVPQMLIVRVA
ncbi:hypothetical protein BJV82DRAFT_714509 [Fennellomyces sp. T-0311]|nr:hypothetical protein BJV82DRAFT_714509 [Fennellomyces sp. T-0311]